MNLKLIKTILLDSNKSNLSKSLIYVKGLENTHFKFVTYITIGDRSNQEGFIDRERYWTLKGLLSDYSIPGFVNNRSHKIWTLPLRSFQSSGQGRLLYRAW